MAARLTDKQKQKIVADYLETESYRATARMNGVADVTVKRIVTECGDIEQKVAEKKRQNTADILKYMEGQKKDVCEVLGICLGELKNTSRYAKTPPQQIATTMAILIDKYTSFSGGPANKDEEDGLSRSLREYAEKLESDDV